MLAATGNKAQSAGRTNLLCSCFLLFIVIVDAAAVLGAPVIALLVQSGGIHMLEETI